MIDTDKFQSDIEDIAASIAVDPFIIKGIKNYIRLAMYYIRNETPDIIERNKEQFKTPELAFTYIIKTNSVLDKCRNLLERHPNELVLELFDYSKYLYEDFAKKIYYIISISLFIYVQYCIRDGKYTEDNDFDALKMIEAILV